VRRPERSLHRGSIALYESARHLFSKELCLRFNTFFIRFAISTANLFATSILDVIPDSACQHWRCQKEEQHYENSATFHSVYPIAVMTPNAKLTGAGHERVMLRHRHTASG